MTFQRKVYLPLEPNDEGCWVWPWARTPDGYGKYLGRHAHRWAYEELVGPVDNGFELDHLCHSRDLACVGGRECRHRLCVNPDHLEVVTRRENVRRREARRTLCRNGVHELTSDNTTYRDGKRMCLACLRATWTKKNARVRDAKIAARREPAA